MKKTMLTALAVVLVWALVSCGGDSGSGAVAPAGFTGDEQIDMTNIDEFLGRDARYVDLRDFSDMFNGGYIAGFEVVPFFQYLEGRALVRNNGWEFSEADVVNARLLENIFGAKEEPVVLMCGSGARAGYTKEALESLGYTKVYNAGGIRDYRGANMVLGDGEYRGVAAVTGAVTMANIDNHMSRPGAKYVDLRNVADKYTGGYIDGFEIISFFEYLDGRALVRNDGWNFSEEDIVSRAVLRNFFGDPNREVFLMCASGARAGYVKDALEAIGYKTVHNVGGIRDYRGNRRVLGDESFTLVLN